MQENRKTKTENGGGSKWIGGVLLSCMGEGTKIYGHTKSKLGWQHLTELNLKISITLLEYTLN